MIIEDKPGTYLLYANGECALVVIGILFALQVNYWNEDKNRDALEISILEELKENLLRDIQDFQININYYEKSVRSGRIIIEALMKRLP
ncbi:MAG: hypothetical protein ACJAT1_000662 [Marivirga sp.]